MTVTEERTTEASSSFVTTARVRRSERISPAFVRMTLSSPDFAMLDVLGFDTRIKLVFPGPGGALPEIPPVAEDWYAAWLAMPDEARAPMRTYTVRDVLADGAEVLLVVDLVVHEPLESAGPACRWAMTAAPGDPVQVIGPRRGGAVYGGTEFDAGERTQVLLAGDETTAPAIARTLLDLPDGLAGTAFVEVPSAADILPLRVPAGVELRWVIRGEAPYGRRLVAEVRDFLGLPPIDGAPGGGSPEPERPSSLDIDVWETPSYSAAGEDVEAQLQRRTVGSDLADLYAWIAGESWSVKALRRALVSELGLDRDQVAFMGYWREGVAMKS